MFLSNLLSVYLSIIILLSSLYTAEAQMQKLKVSADNRFIVTEDEEPFVWIGETNWFFAKLPPTTIDSILDVRSKWGFTMMFVSCREKLYNGDGPGSITKPNEAWWKYLDEYIEKCQKRGMYVGITLGWWGVAKNNSEADLFDYGKWVGNRYKDQNNIVWLTLGEAGSHSRKSTIPDEKIIALVDGIRAGDTGNKLLTIHADFKRGTSISNHADLVDFNNWQTSQWCCIDDLPRKDDRTWAVWEAIQFDYNQLYDGRPKPTLDSEAWYENNKDFCDATPYNIRRRAYFTIFAGAFGHTYGAGGIWDGLTSPEDCSGNALKAINYEGARHIGFLSDFLHKLGHDFLKLQPDQNLILSYNSKDYDYHVQASISNDNRFALVYSASDTPFAVDLSKVKVDSISPVWFNPRTNTYQDSKLKLSAGQSYEFDPPGESGPGNDWVLILGDKEFASKYLRL
ncbi:MAG: DUF4038 domain-containing protein [Cyclobacteriaceae bacterium]